MASNQAPRDPNYRAIMQAASSSGDRTTVDLWADPITHRLLTDLTLTTPAGALKTVTGTASSNGDNTIIAAVSAKRLKIMAYAFFTTSTTAVVATLKDGAGGTGLWTIPFQTITATSFGANLATSYPSFLFATSAGNLLDLALSAAITITYSLTYWDMDAT